MFLFLFVFLFTCPIIYTGDSFERSAIVDWLSRNENCPLTRRPLTTSDLVDNKGLKSILTEYHQQNQTQTRQQKEAAEAQQQKEAAEAQQQKELQLQQLHQLQQQVEQQIKGLMSIKSSGPFYSSIFCPSLRFPPPLSPSPLPLPRSLANSHFFSSSES